MPTKFPPAGARILFANVPADGHFNPLTGIAVHLKQCGYDVRWYTSKKYAPKIESLGIPFFPLCRAMDLASHADPDEMFPERRRHKSQVAKLGFDLVNVFILRGPEYFEDLQSIREEFPFDLLIADITFAAIPMVREVMRIPVIGVNIVPLPETSRDLAPAGLGMTPSTGFWGRQKQHLLRFVADKILFAKPNRVMKQVLAGYGIRPEGSNIFDLQIKKSTLVFQSGTPGFEYSRSDMSRHVYYVGPLLPYARPREGRQWFDEKLHRYEKVILVTQGTVERDVEKLLIPTLEAFKDTKHLVVVTTGGSDTEVLRQRYPQDNIVIEDFIPFSEVMKHADVYVTNGGYGGVLLSIQNRLPMVVGGVHEGKNEINARIGYFDLGINLKTEKPSVPQLKQAVETVLRNKSYAANVARLSDEFNRYSTAALCERYVASLLQVPAKREAAPAATF